MNPIEDKEHTRVYTKILLPINGAPHAFKAAEYARGLLGLNPSAKLTVLHVRHIERTYRVYRWMEVEVPLTEEVQAQIRAAEEKMLNEAKGIFAGAGVEVEMEVLVGSHPPEDIAAFAEKGGFDLIVIGSRNLGEVKSLFAGSVSHRVMHLAKCPVLIVK